jgi:uncharacterized protein YdiU (UPF0061 family)
MAYMGGTLSVAALDGAVLTRIAASHIRVGTMQWAAAHRDDDALRALSDYTRARSGSAGKDAWLRRSCPSGRFYRAAA